MQTTSTPLMVWDNGGRRRLRDRRFFVSAATARERRTHWERRSGYDRRLQRIVEHPHGRLTDVRPAGVD